jgi:3-oxoacyl-[acyl-carrier protein] reductase
MQEAPTHLRASPRADQHNQRSAHEAQHPYRHRTGAARGIGAAVARRLSGDGMAVAVLDFDESACKPVLEAIESAGGTALAVGVDVADEEAVPAAVARVADELGAPTVLVNNAGVTRDNLLFKMTTTTGTRS